MGESSEFGKRASAYGRSTQGGDDPRCVPIKLSQAMNVGKAIQAPTYPEEAHQTWRTLYARQMDILPGRASDDFLEGVEALCLPSDRIPTLSEVSDRLYHIANWQVGRAPGLLDDRDFYSALASRIFPSTDYIRREDELDYTPAPDMFHDIFGHMPMITNAAFSDFYQAFGKVALQATSDEVHRKLERFYWFTVEFGLIHEQGNLKIYGNGILSSYGESLHALTDQVVKKPFDPQAIGEQDYDIWHMQPLLFVIDSYEQLESEFRTWATQSLGLSLETN